MIPLTVCLVTVALLADAPASRPVDGLEAGSQVGTISHPAIHESSGIVASRQFAGVLWTHNDSGHGAELFAINREGDLLAEYKIAAQNIDWEDIAIDATGRLYIADIGNNNRKRREVQVLVVEEPNPASPAASEPLRPDRVFRLRYPTSGAFDAEAFFVHEGRGYLISKQLDGGQARLFGFDLDAGEAVGDLEPVGELPLRIPVTAADISADSKWLAVMTVTGPSVFEINGDLSSIGDGAAFSRFRLDPLAEAITFVPEGVLVTNETDAIRLFGWQTTLNRDSATDTGERRETATTRPRP